MTMLRALLLVAAGFVGGTIAQPLQAQPEGNPFRVGQVVTLWTGDRTVPDCTIEEIRGTFLRCQAPKPDPFRRFPVSVTWYNTAAAASISVDR